MNVLKFQVNDYRSMSVDKLLSIIRSLNDVELQNRIKQSNKKSNIYQLYTAEVLRRVVLETEKILIERAKK